MTTPIHPGVPIARRGLMLVLSSPSGAGKTTISRLLLDGREVWACLWVARNRCILLEPPFPAEEAPAEPEQAPQGGGVFGKLKRRIGLIAEDAVPTASRWLNERLRGTLVWQARHPLGAEADLACCTLDRAEWVAEADEQKTLSPFRQKLAANALEDGLTMSWTAGGLRVVALNRADSAAYCWLDPSGPALLAASLDTIRIDLHTSLATISTVPRSRPSSSVNMRCSRRPST